MGDDVEGGRPVYPSAPRYFIEQGLIPFAVNAAGALERGVQRTAMAARKAPIACLAVAVGVGCLLPLVVRRRA